VDWQFYKWPGQSKEERKRNLIKLILEADQVPETPVDTKIFRYYLHIMLLIISTEQGGNLETTIQQLKIAS